MSTRVMSIRLSYSTLAYCYLLNEKAGLNQHGQPVGTVVSATVESIISASRKLYGIPELSELDAKVIIASYAAKLPGFDAADIVAELRAEKSNGAVKEETRPTALSEQPEPQRPEQHQKAEQKANQEQIGERYDIFSDYSGPDKGEFVQEYPPLENDSMNRLIDNVANRAPAPLPIADLVDTTAQALVEQDEKELLEAVSVGVVERVSPQAEPAQVPKCPWEGVTLLAEGDLLKEDAVYKEACDIDELMVTAVRVVYVHLSHDLWSSDMAIKLVKKTYSDYKNWMEKYGKA